MARNYVNQYSPFQYHITNRSHNREQFYTTLEDTWKILCDQLSLAYYKYNLHIYSFVLMPNHIHLIASSPEFPIGHVMRDFFASSSRDMQIYSKRINQNWGGKYFKCELNSFQYQLNCYKYVYQNPVRAGLVDRAESWRFSTLHGLLGLSKLEIPLQPDTILFNPDFDWDELNWLNTPIEQTDLDSVRMALKSSKFRLKSMSCSKPHKLESTRI